MALIIDDIKAVDDRRATRAQALNEWAEEYECFELFDMMNRKTKLAVRDEIISMARKLFGKGPLDNWGEWAGTRLLNRVLGDPSGETHGAPIKGRTVVAFSKLGIGIPYEVVVEQETQVEIERRFGRPIRGHSRRCECIDCRKQRTAVEAARKRVYRALKLRQEFGYQTHSVPLKEWRAEWVGTRYKPG